MLKNIEYLRNDPIANIIASANGNSIDIKNVDTGIYEIGHFSFEICLPFRLKREEEYPGIPGKISSYGVCDNYQQILAKWPEIAESEKTYVISITPIIKKNQSPAGGWRWHKWGEYIGEHEIKHEYLYDEEDIEKVYVFHIYDVTNHVG